MGGCHPEGDIALWLLQLAVEKPWSMPGEPPFLHKRAYKTLLPPCRGFIPDILGSFQFGGVLSGQRALTIERLLMSGCGQHQQLVKDMLKKL